MKIAKIILAIVTLLALGYATNRAVNKNNNKETVDTRIDNQGYWTRLAAKGIVPYNPEIRVEQAVFSGSKIRASTVLTLDSPDVPVTEINSSQSENSVFINPLDETQILNSNNSATNPIDTTFGANAFYSLNSGTNWNGDIEGAGEDNFGDPAAVIGLNGRWYINYIDHNSAMGVSYSDDMGDTWTVKNAAQHPDIGCDKNHMWIDNYPDSPYEGELYVAWTNFSDLDLGEIGFSYSDDDGETWNLNTDISSDVEALSHNQGVNLSTGPDGELYAVWAIYDSWLAGGSDETAIGMAKSFDGGITWEPAIRIISDIRGIRASGTNKNMRVNSFPVAVVDNSNSADRGTLYITWANTGIPGINTGSDVDVYIIKSFDQGDTWSEPNKVNQSIAGDGKQHYMPWITCDPTTGILSMIYYDDRNVSSTQCEVYCANSVDGGNTWDEFKVSDVSFTPSPIPGLADRYMGDYLGIHAKNGIVYPIWTDNRLGYAMSFCSPYQTNPVNRPINLIGDIVFETGEAQLSWTYDDAPGFQSFIVYRDGDSIGSTVDTTYSEILPEYGEYRYRVTAYYSDNIESGASGILLQWGNPEIFPQIENDSIYDHVSVGRIVEHPIVIFNKGQLPLEYSLSLNSSSKRNHDYCDAIGGGGDGNEYISGVEVGDISNLGTESDKYTDYADMSTVMNVGSNYNIEVTNGKPFDLDQCGVWIDWDINGEFDEDELLVLDKSSTSPIFTGTIVPPPGSVTGDTKMRVRLTYSGDLNPCGSANFGEVEDYVVHVNAWMDLNRVHDTVQPGDSSLVIVEFNTIDLLPGDYFTNLFIKSNDPNEEIIRIPVSLRVDNIIVIATSNHVEVCPESFISLIAHVSGLFDSLTYTWTSNPLGFTSIKSRPFAITTVPTWYIIEIQDGDINSIDSVFVDVLPAPDINLGADTSMCGSETILLNAKNDGCTYLWSTGDTTQTLLVDTLGFGYGIQNYTVVVTNSIECSSDDNISVNFVNCTGINEKLNKRTKIYPNPSRGIVNIEILNPGDQNYCLKIINSSGVEVFKEVNFDINSSGCRKLNLNALNAGIYTLVIISESEKYQSKLIISE